MPISIEQNGETVLPLVVARLPAGSAVALQLSITIHASADLTLRAWAGGSMVGDPGLPLERMAGLDEECREALFGVAIELLGLIPTSGCIVTMAGMLASQLAAGSSLLNEVEFFSLTQLFTSSFLSPYRLGLCLLGELPGVAQVYDAINLTLAAAQALQECDSMTGGGSSTATLPVTAINSFDPNEKAGLAGAGSQHYLDGRAPLGYAVYFENDAEATAPVLELVVTDELDLSVLDPSTLELGPITLGARTIVPAPGQSSFAADVDLRPENDLIVRIRASLDAGTGVLVWRMSSIDPLTGNPPTDPLAGFLPPNVVPPEGDGNVLFDIQLRSDAGDGTLVQNRAEIVFDSNTSILTDVWENTIDASAPGSAVLPLAAVQRESTFLVSWAGTDSGSGIASTTVLVSEDGGAFTPWLEAVTTTSGLFTGRPGREYRFYSVARDGVGNEEEPPATFDASTQVARRARPARY